MLLTMRLFTDGLHMQIHDGFVILTMPYYTIMDAGKASASEII